MAQQLFRIGQTEFWVLADTVEEKIIETYKRSQVEADIAAITNTLANYPNPSTDEYAYGKIRGLLDSSKFTAGEKAYGKDLLERMWQSFSSDSTMIDVINLELRLKNLQSLLVQMAV